MNNREILPVLALIVLSTASLSHFPMFLEPAAAQSKAAMAAPSATPKGRQATAKGKISSRAKITEHIEYSTFNKHRTVQTFTMGVSLEIRNGSSRTIKVKHPFELICENGERAKSHEGGTDEYIKPGKIYNRNIYFDVAYSDISSTYTLTSKTEGFEPIKFSDPDPPDPL